MASESAVCLAAAGLVMGLRDFCSWSEARLPYDGQDEVVTLLSVWGQGARELHAELAQYAPLVVQLEAELWAVLDDGFPGVWHYEVVEALGWAITDWIVTHDGTPPDRAWVTTSLVTLAGRFFRRAPQPTWPALRAVLLRYSPNLPADLLVA
ncbi:hypothetical protein ACFPAG_16675 [Vogesella sp. GCM10023246]|uniref:Cellulose synthase n=1 Tax=Vogesella oryzagri TaxID=3160864 RepID=A0ABV1M860_9NEIS